MNSLSHNYALGVEIIRLFFTAFSEYPSNNLPIYETASLGFLNENRYGQLINWCHYNWVAPIINRCSRYYSIFVNLSYLDNSVILGSNNIMQVICYQK
ncbi:hypothetical protein DERP_005729 [Dermatophagoides pteronyssinus]|uniref:Uncharacterized protein n=1 Tax=Dermatophagoides pteronyssinus TaxID=6956 RepID=A0ABQ8J9I8_DERPT|nr:hypothetical protein DERP_005729 [Dermatophagoides pteronyssinus]